jgi:hypothetical protein
MKLNLGILALADEAGTADLWIAQNSDFVRSTLPRFM